MFYTLKSVFFLESLLNHYFADFQQIVKCDCAVVKSVLQVLIPNDLSHDKILGVA